MAVEHSTFTPKVLTRHAIDRSGNRYGRLLAVSPWRKEGDVNIFWKCACDCGKTTFVRAHLLGKTQSCGCLCADRVSAAKTTHGLSKSVTYKTWNGMRYRCRHPSSSSYKNYGARGITYDPRWEYFANFLSDMGEAPVGMELDRIDNNGNYCKENCRWATRLQQENNKRNNVVVEFRGEQVTVAQLARKCGLTHDQVLRRIRRGWTAEETVSRPFLGQRNPNFRKTGLL